MRKEILLLQQWATHLATVSRLNSEMAEYEQAIQDAEDLTGIAMDGLPHGTTPGSPTEQKAFRAMALRESYDAVLSNLNHQLSETTKAKIYVDQVLDKLPPMCRTICEMRYVNRWNWDRITQETHYSERQAKRYHEMVLRSL